jgi:hypothetical protein
MVTSPAYRHVPTGTLAVVAQRHGTVSASPSTWYRLVRKFGWRRPRVRVHPAKPKVGLRTTGPDEMWHIDTTVIHLLDGTRAYLHAVIDNFSRRILAWRLADTFAPVTSVDVLLEAGQGATRSGNTPVVVADAGVERERAGRCVDRDGDAAGSKLITTREAIKAALAGKATRYGAMDRPFVIALNVTSEWGCDDDDVAEALFGTTSEVVRSSETGVEHVATQRNPVGVWQGPRGPINRRNSAALIVKNAAPWSVPVVPLRL